MKNITHIIRKKEVAFTTQEAEIEASVNLAIVSDLEAILDPIEEGILEEIFNFLPNRPPVEIGLGWLEDLDPELWRLYAPEPAADNYTVELEINLQEFEIWLNGEHLTARDELEFVRDMNNDMLGGARI